MTMRWWGLCHATPEIRLFEHSICLNPGGTRPGRAGPGWAGLALWTLGRSSELRQPRHETSHEGNLLAHATIIFNLQVAVLLAGMLRPAAAGHARPAKLTEIMSTPCPSINSYSYSWKQNIKLDTWHYFLWKSLIGNRIGHLHLQHKCAEYLTNWT